MAPAIKQPSYKIEKYREWFLSLCLLGLSLFALWLSYGDMIRFVLAAKKGDFT